MKVYVDEWSTQVTPSEKDIQTECRPNSGADACVYLVTSSKGSICKYNQYAFNWNLDNILKESIAQRKGCQRVIDWHSQEGNITVETIHRTFDIP